MTQPVRIHYVDRHRWHSLAVYNPNAFPPTIRPIVDATASRLSLVFHHTSAVATALGRDAADFVRMLRNNEADLATGIGQRPDLALVAIYDGVGFVSEIHNALNATKSFLDLHAKLTGKLINERNEWGFGKANIDDRKLAGGRFINALRTSSKDGAFAALADTVLSHSTQWIDNAVTYRDQLSHRSDLNRMIPMHLPINPEVPHVRIESLVGPAMPNGVPVVEYFQSVRRQLVQFIDARPSG